MRDSASVAVYAVDGLYDHEDTAVSPPAKTTDVAKLTVPLPMMAAIVGSCLLAAAGVWRIETKVAVFEAAYTHQRERDADYREYINQRFETLEAKIESAGLRNANMALSQELAKQRGQR
jgi:hypothetical protein